MQGVCCSFDFDITLQIMQLGRQNKTMAVIYIENQYENEVAAKNQ